MQTLEGLRRQIDAATDLGSVVTTMKTLAAVSIHQYEEAVAALTAYERTLSLGFRVALPPAALRDLGPELSQDRVVLLLGSDQGMCGNFNEEVTRCYLEEPPEANHASDTRLLVVGVRAAMYLEAADRTIDTLYETPTSVSGIVELVRRILLGLSAMGEPGGLPPVVVYYQQRRSGASTEPRRQQLLPLSPEQLAEWQVERWPSRSLPQMYSPRGRLLSLLTEHFLFGSLFRVCAESLASENASRIAAMQAAEKNIEERLVELRGSFDRQRQTAITEEILDVVNGFEALATGNGSQASA